MNKNEIKLKSIIYECNQHKKRINRAYGKMQQFLPLTLECFEKLSEDEIEHIDQFLFRFTKLQDSIDEKLFSHILLLLEEDYSNKPFLDLLNRIEKLELLFVSDWLELRVIRNNVAHEYNYNKNEIVDNLNIIYQKHVTLINIFDNLKRFCEERFSYIKNIEQE